MRKIVTSALVITGATALSTMEAGATEADQAGYLQDEINLLELELIEKSLRSYTNPLHRIKSQLTLAEREDIITYEVQSGDTLSGIAQSFGIPVSEIVQENEIKNKHRIAIGQQLKIRLKEQGYIVKHGDSLKDIAEAKGVNTEDIVAYNWVLKESKYTLFPGQEIRIPTAPPEPAHQPLSTPKSIALKKNQVTIASRSEQVSTKIGSFAWPVTGSISSRFGMRWGRPHNGIDISHKNKSDTPISAARSGVVTDAYFHRSGYGNLVIIDHGDGIETYYAHLSKLSVKEGQKVEEGELLGYMGRTGNSTGYHLHFEIRKGNRPLNPIDYLQKGGNS
jgi:murein DD-endopeptidase MepM/ murein hydrolase activator NlpD